MPFDNLLYIAAFQNHWRALLLLSFAGSTFPLSCCTTPYAAALLAIPATSALLLWRGASRCGHFYVAVRVCSRTLLIPARCLRFLWRVCLSSVSIEWFLRTWTRPAAFFALPIWLLYSASLELTPRGSLLPAERFLPRRTSRTLLRKRPLPASTAA